MRSASHPCTIRMFIGLALVLAFEARAAQRHCLDQPTPTPVGSLLLSVNIDTPAAVYAVNQSRQRDELIVHARNQGPQVQFVEEALQPGDCVLSEAKEVFTTHLVRPRDGFLNFLPARRERAAVIPVVVFRKQDGSKHFGVLRESELGTLTVDSKYRETAAEPILQHTSSASDLIILYALCPPDRREVCELTVKDRGRWILDPKTGKPVTFSVLALSDPKGTSRRQRLGGDTPQGIYHVWASIRSPGPRYGGEPRIDLDASRPPLGSAPYAIDAAVLEQLIPQKSFGEYWANEWALAYHLGRNSIRIHSSTLDPQHPDFYTTAKSHQTFLLTAGCLNSGVENSRLLQTLVSAGAIVPYAPEALPAGTPMQWNVSPRVGHAFLIVRDRDR